MSDSSIKDQILDMGRKAQIASRTLATLDSDRKNRILLSMADEVLAQETEILAANEKDLSAARDNHLSNAMIDRLRLDPERLAAIAEGIRQVAELNDPVGEVLEERQRPNGLLIQKKRVPIGVIGIVFESRPNVTSDAAVLCFKTGNATILRGGKEAIHSNRALAAALQAGGAREGMPENSVQLVPFTDRESVQHMAEMDQYLDLIIPRGGAGLIETVVSLARVPVIKHFDGICHVYVDKDADLDMAESIAVNSKMQKPSVCNALETLLIDENIADEFIPRIAATLTGLGVELRGDERFVKSAGVAVAPATEDDWSAEYLDLILAVKTVAGVDGAIDHINKYGSRHSDAIVTANKATAEKFLAAVDSATVFWNASTRFSDGFEFGFGAEIGISTDKLHARGPMGLNELTSYKYLLYGDGHLK